MSIYTRTALLNLLQRAKALGMDLGKGSSLEKMTVAQLEALVSEKEKEMSDPLPPFSARQLAEQVLAFREANAPDKHRFSERALIVDNGKRGSAHKAVIFTGDDLSALLMDLRDAEAALATLKVKPPKPKKAKARLT